MDIEKRLKWSATLICAGLLVMLLSLLPLHPLAFMAFILFGSPLVGAGIVVYLTSLVGGKKP